MIPSPVRQIITHFGVVFTCVFFIDFLFDMSFFETVLIGATVSICIDLVIGLYKSYYKQ